MHLEQIKNLVYTWLITSGLKILLIIGLLVGLIKIVKISTNKLLHLYSTTSDNPEYDKKIQTVKSITISLINFIIISIGTVLILQELGINVGPILAAAGVLGVAIGFGSQRFIEDIISGFIILLNDQIRVGDVVQIGDKNGYVEKIDLQMVVLRDLSGNVHFIRNGKIDIVTNMTRDYSYYVFDIGVAYKENIENVVAILNAIGHELEQDSAFSDDILAPLEILGLDKFDESAIIIKARIKTKPIKQWGIGREFNLRLKNKFDEFGIEIPFPHRTLYIADAKVQNFIKENKV